MALQNRVLPTGEIVADPARGMFTGNRGGAIHDANLRRLHPRRRWTGKAWICCVLRFKDRRRDVMGPGYTNLFFLDEVTALAAGHRPCYECRRADAVRFAEAWRLAFGLSAPPRAADMDRTLHGERTAVTQSPLRLEIADLPDGAVIDLAPRTDGPGNAQTGSSNRHLCVVRGTVLLPWTTSGYRAPMARPTEGSYTVFTPGSILAVLKHGFRPVWHATAEP